jgi:hypothetical protein
MEEEGNRPRIYGSAGECNPVGGGDGGSQDFRGIDNV